MTSALFEEIETARMEEEQERDAAEEAKREYWKKYFEDYASRPAFAPPRYWATTAPFSLIRTGRR